MSATAATAATGSLVLRSGEARQQLLELFTSEGCSSCPPADAWLNALRGHRDLWQRVVPVSFHVDYWNHLGWLDPLSQAAFSERQRRYALQWKASGVYTPALALNGAEWRRPSARLPHASSFTSTTTPIDLVGVLNAQQSGALRFLVHFQPRASSSSATATKLRLVGALLGNSISHRIPRGENAGLMALHHFAVLALEEVVVRREGDGFKAVVQWSAPTHIHAASYSVAFWVTALDDQQPMQCVGGDLVQ